MRYTLTAPMVITSRLMPGVKIGSDTISAEIESTGPGGAVISYVIDFTGPNGGRLEHAGNDITVRAHSEPDDIIRSAMATLCAFLGADGESYQARMGASEPDDGYAFGPAVAEWAYQNSDELSMIESEIEEG